MGLDKCLITYLSLSYIRQTLPFPNLHCYFFNFICGYACLHVYLHLYVCLLWSTEVVYVRWIEVDVTCLLSHSPSYKYKSFPHSQHLFLSTELADFLSLASNLAQVIPDLHFLSYGITGRPSANPPNSMCVLGIRTLVLNAGQARELLTELFLQSPLLLIYASFCQKKWDLCQCYDHFSNE